MIPNPSIEEGNGIATEVWGGEDKEGGEFPAI